MKRKSDTLISVIVPVYNVEKWLGRCLKSILAQTYSNLEIILIDDGSTDNSGEICDRWAEENKRARKIAVVHQENRGLSGARNAGLSVAKGEYVVFVDSDDAIDSSMIEKLYMQAVERRAEIVFSPLCEVYDDGRKKSDILGDRVVTWRTEKCLKNLLLDRGITLSVAGKLFARKLFREVQFPEGRLYEDVGTTYRLVLQCGKIVYLPEALYNYHQNSGSIVHQEFRLEKMDLIEQVDEMCGVVTKRYPSLENAAKKRRCQARFSILRQLMDDRRYANIRAEVVRYFKKHKNDILKNPLADSRDKVAMITLLMGLPVFRTAWRLYAAKNR